MAMRKTNYNVTVYFDTGFNGTDIPRTGAVLENATKRNYNESYYLREDIDLPSISINDSYHNLKDVDYVKLVPITPTQGEPSAYYYFATPSAAAGGTTVLALELDALTTMGGAGNLHYISGWQERGHISKEEDEIFSNVAAEDWTPSQPLVVSDYQIIEPDMQQIIHPVDDLQIVISNIDLIKLGNYSGCVEVIPGGTVDPTTGQLTTEKMYIPSIEITDSQTTFFLMDALGQSQMSSLRIPNTCAYDATNPVVKEGMKKLFSCGQLQLLASYTIPKEFVIYRIDPSVINYTNVTPDGLYTQITGIRADKIMSAFPFEYTVDDYTVKNKKVYATYRSYSLANIASGSTLTKEAYLLKYQNYDAPVVDVIADMVSTGKPSARFLTENAVNAPYVDVCHGAQWTNNQILMEGASGSLWNSVNAAFTQQNLDRELYLNKLQTQQAKAEYGYQAELIGLDQWKANIFNGLQTAGGALATSGAIAALIAGTLATGGTTIPVTAPIAGSLLAGGGALAHAGVERSQMRSRQAIQTSQNSTAANYDMLYKRQNKQAIEQSINENRIGLLKNNTVVAPTPYFSPSPNLAMYDMNKFIIYETKKTRQDLISEDRYYQRYGYNGIHRPLNKQCFNCRQYYCFVQAFDVNIKAEQGVRFGLRVRQKAIAQLNGGVRVWGVLPDAQYYETN